MTDAPHHQAAFINAIAEEGTKAEAVEWLQKTWNELCEARAQIRCLRAYVNNIAITALSTEHLPDEKAALLDHDALLFQRDCGIVEARDLLNKGETS